MWVRANGYVFYSPRATIMGHDATQGHRPEVPSLNFTHRPSGTSVAFQQGLRNIYILFPLQRPLGRLGNLPSGTMSLGWPS